MPINSLIKLYKTFTKEIPSEVPSEIKNTSGTSNQRRGYNLVELAGNKLSQLFGIDALYTDSRNTNTGAIIDHMKNVGYEGNYGVVDKKAKKLYIMNGDKVIRAEDITIGQNEGDGYDILAQSKGRYYRTMPRTTGAGIYKLKPRPIQDIYYYKERALNLMDGNTDSKMAIHAPASPERAKVFKDPEHSRRVSYGCISGNCGVGQDIISKKQLNEQTPLFVLPELNGNYIREKDGVLETVYNNAPKTYNADGKTYNFRYNRQKFKK